MEFTASQKDLLRELSLIQGVVEPRATIPILTNLLLRAKKGGVEIVATDLQVGLRSPCAGKVTREGAVTVSAKRLFDIVRALPDAEVEFGSLDGSQLEIRCRDSRFRLQTLAPEDFPALAEPEGKGVVDLPREAFQDMIDRVLFAVTRDDSRYQLNGALLILQPESMSLVATDGHRLAWVRHRAAMKGIREDKRYLLPKKALAEIARFRKPFEVEEEPEPEGESKKKKKAPVQKEAPLGEKISFWSDPNHHFFRVDERQLVTRTLEGNFPNFERVIPEGNDKVAGVRRDLLMEAARRVSILSFEKSRAIRLHLSKKKMIISSSTPQVGDAEEPIPVDYDGPAMEVAFNGDYLVDWLAHVGSPEVEIALKDGETQGLFRPRGEYPYDYQYIIMPMRL